MNNRILLDGDWSLIYVENKKLLTENPKISEITSLEKNNYSKIPAKVPGNIERDLFRAGIIEDLYFGDNAVKHQWIEKLHMFYYRTFNIEKKFSDEIKLRFEGIDTASEIFINGKKIGETENMLIPHEFEVASYLREGENEIIVHIIPACIAARKYELEPGTRGLIQKTCFISMRKPPHMYGWDIMPRIVSGGIWRSVTIEQMSKDRIDDIYIYTVRMDAEKKTASVCVNFNCHLSEDDPKEYSLKFTGACGESSFTHTVEWLWHTSSTYFFDLEDVKFWWPKNYGDANMYECKFQLLHLGRVVAEYKTCLGIRMVELDRTDMTDEEGNGKFIFIVNGKKIFVNGTNWVPADAIHSYDAERIPHILPLIDDIGCNMIRIWGGNVYENDMLYDWCDNHGIMIWQDFIMACSMYPQDENFKSRLFVEASAAVKRLRCHPSIVLWAGDNECDEVYFWGDKAPYAMPSQNANTRIVIPSVLRIYDQSRPYLPSSPYLSDEIARTGKRYYASENHIWGDRDYFKKPFYADNICHFISETGYHGCASPDSMKRFIAPEQLWPWTDEKTPEEGNLWNLETTLPRGHWLAHATSTSSDDGYGFRTTVMVNQVITLFGKQPDDLDTFAYQSQISQAEANKFFIERFRATKWRRTGIIWWNLIDGWPQTSDAIIDYYGCKKLAYHYIKRSQNPLCLIFKEPSDGNLTLVAASDLQEDKRISFKVTDLTDDSIVLDGSEIVKSNDVTPLLDKKMIEGEKRFYLIEWELDGVKYKNHYFTNIIDIDYEYYISCMKKAGFYDEFEGFGDVHPRKSDELPYVFTK